MSLPSLVSANRFSTTRVVSDAMSSLLTYSGEMFSIDPTMCFNVERVTSKSRIVCCEQTPSGPRRILVKLVIFLTSEMQCLKKPFTCPITSMASLAENVFTLARGSFLLRKSKNSEKFIKVFQVFQQSAWSDGPQGRMTLLNVQLVYPFVALRVLSEKTIWRLVCRS